MWSGINNSVGEAAVMSCFSGESGKPVSAAAGFTRVLFLIPVKPEGFVMPK